MASDYVYEQKVPQPVSTVWQAITRPDLLNQWFMKSDFKAEIGHAFRLQPDAEVGGDPVDCQVVEVSPPSRLAYRWRGGPMMDSLVAWELRPDGQGTHVKVTHTGISKLKGYFVSGLLGTKWRRFDSSYLDRLKTHLSQSG